MNDLDSLVDLYGYLDLLVLALVLVGAFASLVFSHIEVWEKKRELLRTQMSYQRARASFHRTHGY